MHCEVKYLYQFHHWNRIEEVQSTEPVLALCDASYLGDGEGGRIAYKYGWPVAEDNKLNAQIRVFAHLGAVLSNLANRSFFVSIFSTIASTTKSHLSLTDPSTSTVYLMLDRVLSTKTLWAYREQQYWISIHNSIYTSSLSGNFFLATLFKLVVILVFACSNRSSLVSTSVTLWSAWAETYNSMLISWLQTDPLLIINPIQLLTIVPKPGHLGTVNRGTCIKGTLLANSTIIELIFDSLELCPIPLDQIQ